MHTFPYDCHFIECNMSGVHAVDGVSFQKCSFSNVNLSRHITAGSFQFVECNFVKCDFTDSDVAEGVPFMSCEFEACVKNDHKPFFRMVEISDSSSDQLIADSKTVVVESQTSYNLTRLTIGEET